jgi:uncharacterized membrane-anchored protein
MPIQDHPLRYALVNELHARPFPALAAPSQVLYLAIKQPVAAHARDRAHDRDHLLALLDQHGAPHPAPDATHHAARLGRVDLKWESHTEFVTYSAFTSGLDARAFDPAAAQVLPEAWAAAAPGRAIVAALIRIDLLPDNEDDILPQLDEWFVPESLAVARVVDGAAVVAGDFRIDPAGFMRFAVFVRAGTGARRIGRIVQRLCEIETYRAMSMLGLPRARDLSRELNALDPRLSDLVAGLDGRAQTTAPQRSAEAALHELLSIAAALESLSVTHNFRFSATKAYEAIVTQRIEALREARVQGRQTFAEFMMRRYDPAMRTTRAAEARLAGMAERAARAAELLRTRVDVERSAQNQALLQSMDTRADMALRLQHTVEGLSVVAVSYYALGLMAYILAPLGEALHLPKSLLMAGAVPLVLALVWWGLRRLRARVL